MANLRELMLRLRPAGAPGAATGAGVPSDRRKGAEHELEPVFAALAGAVAQAGQIRVEARARAEQRLTEAKTRSRAMLDQAALDATSERAELAARLRARAQQDAARLVRDAQTQAARIREDADARLGGRVETIVNRVREQLAEVARP